MAGCVMFNVTDSREEPRHDQAEVACRRVSQWLLSNSPDRLREIVRAVMQERLGSQMI